LDRLIKKKAASARRKMVNQIPDEIQNDLELGKAIDQVFLLRLRRGKLSFYE
jgi:hypothetical protein